MILVNRRYNNFLMLLINLFIVISTFVCMIIDVSSGAGEAQLGDLYGINYFKAFTTDSNMLNALFCFALLVFNIDNLVNKKNDIPYWATVLQYVGTTAVTLTMSVTIFFLSPMQVLGGNSFFRLFKGTMLYLHLVNPVLSIIEILLLNNNFKLSFKDNIYACLPTFVYCCVYTPMVVSGSWIDFYNFTFGGQMYLVPIMIVVMHFITYLLGLLIRLIHNKNIKYE